MLAKLTGEKVSDGRKVFDGLGRANPPLSLHFFLRRFGNPMGDLEEANLRVVRLSDFLLGIHRQRDWPFHVGLTRRHPNFSDQHIPHDDFAVTTSEDEIKRTTRRCWRQSYLPAPFLVCRRRNFLPTKSHPHPFVGRCRAPKANGHIPLHHHVVGNQRGQPHLP